MRSWLVLLLCCACGPLTDRSFAEEITALHREARSTGDPALAAEVDRLYAEYFREFPEGKHPHEMRFFWAELLYDQVHDYGRAYGQYERALSEGGVAGRYSELAAFDAILAAREAQTPEDVARSSSAPMEWSLQDFAFVEACDRYRLQFPSARGQWEVAWNAARPFLDHEDWDEAARRFDAIAAEFPKVGEQARVAADEAWRRSRGDEPGED